MTPRLTQSNPTSSASVRRRPRGGFTLTELLVVISVIVLSITMAVPLFNVFSGSRSIETSENLVSAMLQRARARALGTQERRGVFFFEDQATKKTAMLIVRIDPPVNPPAIGTPPTLTPEPYVLELDEQDEELQPLPTGVGVAFALGANPTGATPTANTTASTYRPYGLVAFDGAGRVLTIGNYTTEANDPNRYPNPDPASPGVGQSMTRLKWHYGKNIYPAGAAAGQEIGKAVPGSVVREFSHMSFLLFDKQVYAEVPPDPGVTDWRKVSDAQNKWLDQNGVAIVVNRYNGTLIRGE